jgi:hypothetical protein
MLKHRDEKMELKEREIDPREANRRYAELERRHHARSVDGEERWDER